MDVSLHRTGAFLTISFVVCNIRLAITLKRLGVPLILSVDPELKLNKKTLSAKEDQSRRTHYLLTEAARRQERISRLDSSPLGLRKPSGDA